ncbi:MAG: fumarylacetoacetate hydrolase family protein [Burkholderiaceae bacterium]|nr:fumarylacetoacetate hydrolase family protein [Burkholderiaceae bacterium]
MANVVPMSDPALAEVRGGRDRFPVRRVYCVGRNYAAHAREMGFDPDRDPPFFFCKPADAVVSVPEGSVASIPYPPKTANYHHEVELVVAIGREGANIPVASAAEHVWGYAVGLDMTRRDLQFAMRDKGRPWELGKAFDASAPMGPLVAASEVPDIAKAGIWLDVDGQRRQESSIAHLIWSIPETIAYLSEYFRLMPGDLIFTGTPEGVGPVEPGAMLHAHVDGVPELRIQIV